MDFIKKTFFSSYPRIAGFLALAALILSIPVSVSLLKQKQNLNQQAHAQITCPECTTPKFVSGYGLLCVAVVGCGSQPPTAAPTQPPPPPVSTVAPTTSQSTPTPAPSSTNDISKLQFSAVSRVPSAYVVGSNETLLRYTASLRNTDTASTWQGTVVLSGLYNVVSPYNAAVDCANNSTTASGLASCLAGLGNGTAFSANYSITIPPGSVMSTPLNVPSSGSWQFSTTTTKDIIFIVALSDSSGNYMKQYNYGTKYYLATLPPPPVGATPTPIQGVNTPTPIPGSNTPTPGAGTSTPTPTKSTGLTCDPFTDGKINIQDYSEFVSQFTGVRAVGTADCDKSGKVDIVDYSILIKEFLDPTIPH